MAGNQTLQSKPGGFMKFAMIAILATTFATTVNATSIRRFRGTVESTVLLNSSRIAPEHMQYVTSGSVVIDYTKNTVSLNLTFQKMNPCPRGRFCAAYMPAPIIRDVTLPIVNIQANACGILTVTAMKDKRPVDGLYEEINVEDTTKTLRCAFVRAPDVRASYKTINPWTNGTAISKMYLQIERKSN